MKNLSLVIILVFASNSFGQGLELHYAKSEVPQVRQPTTQIINAMNRAEERYYQNRQACSDIELYILKALNHLTIDSINTMYRGGLKINLKIIRSMQSDAEYGDYTLSIMDIVEDLKRNEIYYEDEQQYIAQNYQLELKKNQLENERLKNEIEVHKNQLLREKAKKTVVKKIIPKKSIKKKQ